MRTGMCVLLLLVYGLPKTVLANPPVTVYTASSAFEDVMEGVQMAVTDRGLLVSGTLHVSDMLNRTGNDLGYPDAVYARAESVEFCSALMSHRMIAVDPRNLVICPFTVAVYTLKRDPDQVYVAYRKQQLAGDDPKVTTAVNEMLDEIAREASEF